MEMWDLNGIGNYFNNEQISRKTITITKSGWFGYNCLCNYLKGM